MDDMIKGAFGAAASPVYASAYTRRKIKLRPIFSSRPRRIWLVSFTDFMSLMVAFFVMMYAMSTPDLGAFKKMTESLDQELSAIPRAVPKPFQGDAYQAGDSDTVSFPRTHKRDALDPGYLSSVIAEKKKSVPALGHLTMTVAGGDILLSLPLEDLIDVPGGRSVRMDAAVQIAGFLNGATNRIEMVMTPANEDEAAWNRAIADGIAIKKAMQAAGYDSALPLMFRPSKVDSKLPVIFRVVRYRDDP